MLWIALDILIPLAAVVALGSVALGLWRRVKALSKQVGKASDAVGVANDSLASAQAAAPARRRVG